jgi:glucose-6-phosphate 1-epimerase
MPPKRPVLLAGHAGLPKLVMTAADGARAEIYLQGARLASWIPASGSEWLFLNEAELASGGLPLIFPQAGPDNLAGTFDWNLIRVEQDKDQVRVCLQLADSRASRRLWRHRFLLELEVTVGSARLELRWSIKNSGQKPLRFSAALRQYLRLAAGLGDARLLGLEQQSYRDPRRDESGTNAVTLNPSEGCDRYYPNAAMPLLLHDGRRTLRIHCDGLPAVGLWLPGQDEGAPLAAGQQTAFLRLEATTGEQPLKLQPSETWNGGLVFAAADRQPVPAV